MTEPKPKRRSRIAWAEPVTSEYAALYRQKRRVHLLLGVAVLVLALAVGTLTFFVYQQQQYVEGRGEYRDRETERLQQQILDAVCDLLDQLPEGGLLEAPRNKYGCGPGRPLEDFPEDVRQRYAPRPEPQTAAAPTPQAPPPPMGSPAVPNPPRPSESPRTPPPTTAPPPSPDPEPPADPLEPVTETVCDLINVCLEESP